MMPCLHCKKESTFLKEFFDNWHYYRLICMTCKRVAWVGKTV